MGKFQLSTKYNAMQLIFVVALQAKFYAKPNISETQQSIIEYSDRSSVSDGVRFAIYYDETDYCQSNAPNFLIQPSNTWILVYWAYSISQTYLC